MNIHEYQAKQLFEKFGVTSPKGIVASTAEEAGAAARVPSRQRVASLLLPMRQLHRLYRRHAR